MTIFKIRGMEKKSKSIAAAKFKEKCLKIIDEIDVDGVIITKHGRPVAKLVPIASSCTDLIGCLKGKMRLKGNIFSTGIKWRAES